MTTKSEQFKKLRVMCRICLKGDGPMSSIFAMNATENDEQTILATRITSIAQVQISPGDGLPVFICQSCRRQVNKFYDFRLLVEISDRALRSYLDETRENDKIKAPDYQEFLVDNNSAEDSKDLFAVNTILVPSGSETEVWRICSIEDGDQEEKRESKMTKQKIARSIRDDGAGAKKSFPQKLQAARMLKNTEDKESLFFMKTTSKNNDRERTTSDTESSDRLTLINGVNSDDEKDSSSQLEKYSCQLCLKPFKSLRTLKSHVKDHFLGGKERIQICEIDERNARSARKLQNSIRKSSAEMRRDESSEAKDTNSANCQTCRRSFASIEELVGAREKKSKANDTMERMSGKMTSEKYKMCVDCGFEIMKISDSDRDQAIHADSSLTCSICKKNFRNAQSFKMHRKRHTLGSRFNCAECGKSYYSNSELARHAQLHTGTRKYPCRLCEMSFFSRPELNRHTKYHRGEKKFECKICFKTYYESGHLKVHQRAHTGEKPFSCNVCEKAFTTKSKLIRHSKIHEKNRPT